MLKQLFTSKTRVKILNLLMFNQDKDYHLREIARLIDVSPVYAGKELNNLLKLSLVNESKKGNLNIYSINKISPILDELRKIFIKTDYLGELIKKYLKDRAKYVFIYGSFARGEESQSSDIDLFVIGEIKEDELISIIQKIEKTIQREVNYVLWNEKTFLQRAKSHHLLKTIKKEKVIMIAGNENEFRKAIE